MFIKVGHMLKFLVCLIYLYQQKKISVKVQVMIQEIAFLVLTKSGGIFVFLVKESRSSGVKFEANKHDKYVFPFVSIVVINRLKHTRNHLDIDT